MSAIDISQDPLTSLFKDGVSEELFRLLWSKDELNFGPSVNIPDTIVYKFGQPHTWYFTALSGRIKRKNRQNLLSEKIEEVFNKHVMGYDVIAYFINVPIESENRSIELSPVTIEYFDRAALNDFLYKRKKVMNGILQRFIEPKTTRNEMIRAIWSPKVCLLERAENVHQLHDHRYGLYERCVIYEGPEYYVTSAPLRGPVLSGQIQKLCEAIVSHISEVTYGQKQISRIVLNFKVDSRDKVWFMYSTSIRCIDMLNQQMNVNDSSRLERTLVNIDSVISLSSDIHLNPKISYDKIVPKKKIRCLSCTNETLDDMRYPVSYKIIIKHYEHVLHLLSDNNSSAKEGTIEWPPDNELVETAGGVGFGSLYLKEDTEELLTTTINVRPRNIKDLQIPPILSHLHPRLTLKSYLRCKNDPLFLYKCVNVCEPCYLVYAEFASMLLRMGQDLSKLLTADPVALTNLDRTAKNRPSSADWRAISIARENVRTKSSDFKAGDQHRKAKASAIGIRSSDTRIPPTIPNTIRSPKSGLSTFSNSFIPSKSDLQETSQAANIQDIIAERERRFFKEVSLNPQLKEHHPLLHLISAQEKLKLIDQQSGVLMSKAASSSESIFGVKYGKQKGDKYSKFSVYGVEQPYAIGGSLILPSKLPELRKTERARKIAKQRKLEFELAKNVTRKSTTNVEEGVGVNLTGESEPILSEMSAADRHRDFLANALKSLENEVDNARDFVAATGSRSSTPVSKD